MEIAHFFPPLQKKKLFYGFIFSNRCITIDVAKIKQRSAQPCMKLCYDFRKVVMQKLFLLFFK